MTGVSSLRVAYLTAGAGGMYCGSCMRDNALAAALIRKKRDVILIPVYSPIRTDEEDVSDGRVLYGGINIFLQQKSGLFRHLPKIADRLLDHPALLRLAMKRAGSSSPDVAAPITLSVLRGEDGAQKREVAKLIESLRELAPTIVHLPNAMFVGLAEPIRRALGVPVVCTLTGEDIFLEKLPPGSREEAFKLIRERVRHVDGFISVSRHYTAYAVEHFGIEPSRIHAVPLGISAAEHSLPDAPDVMAGAIVEQRPFTIGYLARVCHDKGLHLLAEAFSLLHARGRVCRLVVAGYLGESDRPYFESVRVGLGEKNLHGHVEHLGEVDRAGKFRMLRSIDVFSVPTVYQEAKGLYILEALSQGVPVVQPAHGSFPELIEATGGGLLFEPHKAEALADSIEQLMDDPVRRAALGHAGREAVRSRFTDEVMADEAWRVFEKVAAGVRN